MSKRKEAFIVGYFTTPLLQMAGRWACHFPCVKLHQHKAFVASVLNLASHTENSRVKFSAGYFLTFMVFFLIKCNIISRDEK